MTRRRLGWTAALCVALALPAAAVRGDDPWWVVKPRKAAAPAAPATAVSLGRPVPLAALGRPVPAPEPPWNPRAAPSPAEQGWNVPTLPAAPTGWDTSPIVPPTLGPPTAEAVTPAGYDDTPGAFLEPRVARGQPPDPAPPGALVGPPPTPPVADGGYNTGVAVDQPLHHPFLEGCQNWFNFGSKPSTCGSDWFKSDRFCDDALISPVTNPFFFEDPRSVTEIDPLLIVSKAPKSNGGGNVEFYGLQGRLALSQQWSIVINKLGFISLNPQTDVDGYHPSTGFAEFDVGPKFTFWRDENLRNVAAVGLNIEAPIGSKSVFQDTGTLGLDPYITYGQTFGRSSFGSFDFLGEAGYSFAADDKRSEFFHASAHIDYDVANLHRIYPLLEMNYFHYTRRGDDTDLGFEGADLVNFGSSTVGKRDLLTIAPGARYKINEWASVGAAVEFALTQEKDLEQYRFTLDLTFRY